MPILKYKTKEGEWKTISNYAVKQVPVVQTTGTSEEAVMSQKAVTDEFGKYQVKGDYATTASLANYFNDAVYTDGTGSYANKKVIAFKHGGEVKVQVDCTDFIKDGMIDKVEITGEPGNKSLVITWNTDTEKTNTTLPLVDLFDASNYVSKDELKKEVTKIFNETITGSTSDDTNLKEALSELISELIKEAITSSSSELKTEINNFIANYVENNNELQTAIKSAHTHTNKTTLDEIMPEDIQKWNSAVQTLPNSDVTGTAGASNTITSFSQTNGKVTATFSPISITKSQVSDLGTIGAAASKGVVTSVSDSADLPTASAVKSFVEGKGYVTTDTDTTYTFAEGTTNGAFTVTPKDGTPQTVNVHGLGSAAYKAEGDFLAADGKANSATVADSANAVALENVTGANDLKAIEALTGTSGILKKTAADTWSLDTTEYATKTDLNDKANSATTLGGYNISDAKIEGGVITLGNQTITPITAITKDNVESAVESAGFTKTQGTVKSVAVTVPTGLSVSPSAVTESGTFAITLASGYEIPQTATLDKCLKGSVKVVNASGGLTNQTTSVSAGEQETIIYTNTGSSGATVSISTNYKTPDGQQINLTIPSGGYGEVNFLNVSGTIYARGV